MLLFFVHQGISFLTLFVSVITSLGTSFLPLVPKTHLPWFPVFSFSDTPVEIRTVLENVRPLEQKIR